VGVKDEKGVNEGYGKSGLRWDRELWKFEDSDDGIWESRWRLDD
jgi:hypothetical protein